MRVEVYDHSGGFDTLAGEWNALAEASQVNTPFQRREFQQVWWRNLGEGELRLLAVRDEDGTLAGLASVFVDPDGVLRWVGREEIADYLDVIAPADRMEAVRLAVFEWLASDAAPPWTRAQFSNIPGWTDTPQHWRQLAAARGWQAEVSQIDVCPVVELPGTYDDYLMQIASKQRREIKRKVRRAQSSGEVAWRIVGAGNGDINAATESFMALMAASSVEKQTFLTPQMRAAFIDLFATMHQAGWLQIAFLDIGGEPTAAYVNFDLAQRTWVYNSGINMTSAARALSPGWVLLAHLIEQAIENGHTHYDFLQGDEDYKYRFGGVDVPVMRLVIER